MPKKNPLIEEVAASKAASHIFEYLKDFDNCVLLESQMPDYLFSRYSFIGIDPFLIFKSRADTISITEQGVTKFFNGNPFEALKEIFHKYSFKTESDAAPFQGGAMGYFGYEMAEFIERLPRKSIDDLNVPDCVLGFYDKVIIFDKILNKVLISALSINGDDPKSKLLKLRKIINSAQRYAEPMQSSSGRMRKFTPNISKGRYISSVKKIKHFIKRGDIYQANFSQRFSCSYKNDPYMIYKKLRDINPAPFGAYLNFDDLKIVSASPERFLRIDDRSIQTRPIKGTRPRGINAKLDKNLSVELVRSAKDNAELLMIIDLERNDLGRICKYNSIRVPRLAELETFQTVFHLVSTIEGRLLENIDVIDCLMACFPGGSITGAPKIRAIEILDELEPTQRKVYTGCIGYIGFNMKSDLNIAIRTIICKNGKAHLQVGGGIVIDSDPELEYKETLHKAKALFEAINNT